MLEGALIPTSALQYKGDSPISYALLKGWDINVGTWSTAQRVEFTKWSNSQPEEAGFGSYTRPRPKPVNPGEAFGPGPDEMYQGSYDGVGDSVLWPVDHAPPQDVSADWEGRQDVDEIVAQYDANIASDPNYYSNRLAAANYDQYDLSTEASTERYAWGRYASEDGSSIPSSRSRAGTIVPEAPPPASPFDQPAQNVIDNRVIEPQGPGELKFGGFDEFKSSEAGADLLSDALSLSSGAPSRSPFLEMSPFAGDLAGAPEVPSMPASFFDNIRPDQLPGINNAFEAAKISANSVGDSLYSVRELTSELSNLIPGLALTPFLMWLQRRGKKGKQAVDIINLTGEVAAILQGSGVGTIAGAAGELVQIYGEQRERIKSNNWGEDVSDKKWAMVEDGGVWYPAILRNRLKGEGLIDDSNNVTLVYGKSDEFYLGQDRAGQVRGHFVHPKTKTFRMDDDEYDSVGYDHANQTDFMRQFYFLSDDQVTDMLGKYGTDEFKWEEEKRDVSDFTPFMKHESDFIAQLDFIKSQNDPFADPTMNAIPASKSFRWTYNKQKWLNTGAFKDPDPRGGEDGAYPTDHFGQGTWFDDTDAHWYQAGRPGLDEWHNVLDDYIPRQMEALYLTRDMAAAQVGIDSKFYSDFSKDLPPAQNVDELRQQYATIDGYSDRTDLMKNYLKQKAATRSMMQAVGVAGYGSSFADDAHKKDSWLPQNYDKDTPEEVPAWLNEGEQGVPEWMDVSDSRRKKEAAHQDLFETYIAQNNDFDPNGAIDHFGKTHNTPPSEKQKWVDKQKSEALDDRDISQIPFNNMVKTGKRTFNKYWSKRVRRRNAKIQTLQTIKEIHNRVIEENKIDPFFTEREAPYIDKPTTQSGEKVTYQKVLQWIAGNETAPEYELGEPSRAHFYKALLEGVYSWAPKNLALDEKNLPDNYLKGQEATFKHMLKNLDPKYHQQADRMHNMVHKPDTEAYVEKYHPHQEHADIAKDASNTTELFNDWALPYEKNLNQVKFNGMIHSQMDFGISEDV